MKIVCISSLLPNGHYSQILFSGLNRKEDLDLIVYSDCDPQNDSITDCGTIKRVWKKGFRYAWDILKELDHDRPDVVHLQHELNMYGGPFSALLFPILIFLINRKGYQTVTTIHGVVAKKQVTPSFIDQFMPSKPFYINPTTLKLFFHFIYTFIGLASDHIVCHTQRLKDVLIQDYGYKEKKVTVIPPAIPKKEVRMVNKKPYFFYFGYMVRRKGIEYLLDGFQEFVKKYPTYKLIMAGGVIKGQEGALQEIKEQIAKRKLNKKVEIRGFIETERELAALYNEAYAVVIPARLSIAASGPLYQARGYHKCILASYIGNFKEEVNNGVDGMLVDNDKWQQALEKMVTDPKLCQKLETASAERARRQSQIATASVYEQLYSSVVAQKKRRFEMERGFFTNIYNRVIPMSLSRYPFYRIHRFKQRILAECDLPGMKILDIGAGYAEIRNYIIHAHYVSQDIIQNPKGTIDIVGDINQGIPSIKDNSYDSIICTQVLEHLYDPKRAFTEFYRILKPNGKLYLSTNLCYEEHMVPYDYFRFTRYGLRYLGESSQFKVTHLEPHGGIFILLSLIIDTIVIKQFVREGSRLYFLLILITTPFRLIFNAMCIGLDTLDRDKKWTTNFEVIYQKSV